MSNFYENQPSMVQAMRRRLIRPEREGEYWTEEERDQLRRCFDEGMDVTDIAIQLRRSEPAIMQQIEKQDLYGRKTNPRRRKSVKNYCCLCSACQAPDGLCPIAQRCAVHTEADENE